MRTRIIYRLTRGIDAIAPFRIVEPAYLAVLVQLACDNPQEIFAVVKREPTHKAYFRFGAVARVTQEIGHVILLDIGWWFATITMTGNEKQ